VKPQPRAVARLPLALDPWEVELLDVDVRVQGTDVEGLLLVVEATTGLVRHVSPVERGASLREPLLAAMQKPGKPTSKARPRLLLCRDEVQRARILDGLDGIEVDVRCVPTLPALDAVATSLRAKLGTPFRWPGVTEQVPRWREALRSLARAAPWEELSDGVTFRFEGGPPGLADAVVVVIGLLGEQRGIVLFPSEASYTRFLGVGAAPSADDVAALDTLCVHLEPADEVDPRDLRACEEAGFVLDEGLVPQVFAMRDGELVAVDAAGQAVLLAAVEAVTALCGNAAGALEAMADERRVRTTHGTVTVRSTPPDDGEREVETGLVDAYEHGILFTRLSGRDREDPAPAVVLKLAKRDAERLAAVLADVDRMTVETHGGRTAFRVAVGERELGLLVAIDHVDDVAPRFLAELAGGRGWVAVSGGGTTRPTIDPRKFTLARPVRVEVIAAEPAPRRAHDPVFDAPLETWPKASATLLDFVEPLMPNPRSSGSVEMIAQMGSMVWNAVVLADFGGDASMLDDLQRAARDIGLLGRPMQELIARKREVYGGDPRLFELAGVKVKKGEAIVTVNTRLPAGFGKA
jgi:hypothetical protein